MRLALEGGAGQHLTEFTVHVQCLPCAICQDTSVVAAASQTRVLFCRCCRCQLSICHYLYIMAPSNQSGPSPLPGQPSTSGKSALYSNSWNYSPCAPQLHSSFLDFSMLPGLALAALAWVTLSQPLKTALGESIQNSSQAGGQLARLAASAALTLTLETDIPPP